MQARYIALLLSVQTGALEASYIAQANACMSCEVLVTMNVTACIASYHDFKNELVASTIGYCKINKTVSTHACIYSLNSGADPGICERGGG